MEPYCAKTKIWARLGQITPKFDKVCPLAIQNQLSMHLPDMGKINWCLLKLSSRKEIWMDGCSHRWTFMWLVINIKDTVELRWLEHRWLVYHGLFELIFESLQNFSDSSRTHISRKIFLFYYEIVCYLLRSDSNEYMQHTIILLKIENISINYCHLLPDLVLWLNLIGSNYSSLEQISMVPKMFEPLKFDCTKVAKSLKQQAT